MNSRDKQLTYGIAYTEMANINLLSTQVQQANFLVAENQAIVTALSAKLDQFNGYLGEASDNRSRALNIYNMAKDVASNCQSLSTNVILADKQMTRASDGMETVAASLADLVGKLIFSVEIIEKFNQIINKQKVINPLIPDTLIALMTKASSDANKAIAFTLVALQSSYAASSTSLEAKSITALEKQQAGALCISVLNNPARSAATTAGASAQAVDQPGILVLTGVAYRNADLSYRTALQNVTMVTTQLASAQAALDSANTQLSSSAAGLAAATAAAYAA